MAGTIAVLVVVAPPTAARPLTAIERDAEAHRDPGEHTRLALPDRDAGRSRVRSGTQSEQGS